jgi:rhodanese-related sulfurtransferase
MLFCDAIWSFGHHTGHEYYRMTRIFHSGKKTPASSLRACRVTLLPLGIVIVMVLMTGPVQASVSSPFRAFYPEVATISTTELHERLFTLTLIDIRSRFEFEVVHIARSINLPLEDGSFADRIDRLRPVQEEITMVLIGNDPDCSRAFEAAVLARAHGLTKLLVYDAGVFSWLHAYPERTRLMGQSPARLEQILPLISHQSRVVSFERFKRLADEPGALVVDIRNIYQRRRVPAGLDVHNISLEALLAAVGNRIWANRPLLIFDEDGSKTRWLQLFLRAGGFFDYAFLDGGMNSLPLSAQELVEAGDDESISVNQLRLRESLNDLWNLGQASEFLSYILSCLRRENIAFVPAGEAVAHLGISREQLRSFSEELARTGQLRFFETDGNFVYQVDPLLAWKGAHKGMTWNKRVNQFHQRSDQ